jgi:hypothetical protein
MYSKEVLENSDENKPKYETLYLLDKRSPNCLVYFPDPPLIP